MEVSVCVADVLRVRHKHDNEQHPPSQGKDDASHLNAR